MSTNRLMMGSKAVGIDDYIAYIERTIKSYSDDELDSVGFYAFYSCSSLTSIDLPACTSVGSSAFDSCASNVLDDGDSSHKNIFSVSIIFNRTDIANSYDVIVWSISA